MRINFLLKNLKKFSLSSNCEKYLLISHKIDQTALINHIYRVC